MQKAAVIKQTQAIILMTAHYLLEASGAPAFTLQQGCWITEHKRRFFIIQRAAKCGLHNSVKLNQSSLVSSPDPTYKWVTGWGLGTRLEFTGIGLEFVLRHPWEVGLTVTECFS